MKLLHLPFLVQRQTFEELHPSSIFFLSLCSKRMSNIIKRMLKRMKPEVQMELGFKNSQGIFYDAFSVKSGRRTERIFDVLKGPLDGSKTQFLKLSNLDLKCELSQLPSGTIIIKHCELGSIAARLIETLCSVFDTTKSDVLYKMYGMTHFNKLPLIPIKKSIITIQSLYGMDDLDRFYSFCTCQDFSMVVSNESGHLKAPSKDHRIFLTKNLVLKNFGTINPSYLINFQGEHAVFRGMTVREKGINEFLKSWMTRSYDSVMTIVVQSTYYKDWNREQVFEGLKSTEREKREKDNYNYGSMIKKYENFPRNLFDCSGGMDIRRDNDWRKATVKLTPFYFMFLVW